MFAIDLSVSTEKRESISAMVMSAGDSPPAAYVFLAVLL